MKSGGQYQVVIGNHVPQVYDDISVLIDVDQLNATKQGEQKPENYYTKQLISYQVYSNQY